MQPSTTSIHSTIVKGLLLVALFFLVQAGLIAYTIGHAKDTVVKSTRQNTIASSALASLGVLAQQVRHYEKEYFISVDSLDRRTSYERDWRTTYGKLEASLAHMRTGSEDAFDTVDQQQIALWQESAAFYAAEMQKVFLAVNERAISVAADKETRSFSASVTKPASSQTTEAPALPTPHVTGYSLAELNNMIKTGKDRFSRDLVKGVEAMSILKTNSTLALAREAEDEFNQVQVAVVATSFIGIVVALLLGQRLPKIVIRPIDSLSQAAHEMSLGDLSQEYDANGVVEFEKLAQALNRMRLGHQTLVDLLQRR